MPLEPKEYMAMVVLAGVTMIGIYQGYFFTQRYRRLPTRSLQTRLDNLFNYHPAWVWIYAPLYYLGFFTLIFLLKDLKQFHYILFSFIVLLVIQMGFFWFFPVATPPHWRKPSNQGGLSQKMLGLVQRFDERSNGFPSMHVSAATLVALHAVSLWPHAWPWTLLFPGMIALSALYTKQHFVINVIAGGILGWLVFLLTQVFPHTSISTKTPFDFVVMVAIATVYVLGQYEFYYFCQRHPAYKPWFLEIFVDRWIRFNPHWVWVYSVSFYLLFYLIVALIPDYKYFLFMATTFFLLLIAQMIFFIFLPSILPARYRAYPATNSLSLKLLKLIHKKDGLSNTFPSMHVSSITVLILHTQNILPAAWPGALLLLPIIATSTLFVKQHYFVDTLAGALLGWGVFALVSAIY